MNQVMPDQLGSFLTFTNITTVRNRTGNRKIISSDFIDVVSGWFRAQYITVKPGADEISLSVGYAALRDHPGATLDELEHIADAEMYKEKEKYY